MPEARQHAQVHRRKDQVKKEDPVSVMEVRSKQADSQCRSACHDEQVKDASHGDSGATLRNPILSLRTQIFDWLVRLVTPNAV
jgi:uncharacterized protein (DUF2235 family)